MPPSILAPLLKRTDWLSPRRLALLALLAGLVLAVAFAPLPATMTRADQPATREVQMEARTFEFTPNVIRVNRGDRVVIDLAAMDVAHGLYVDGYDVQTDAKPGVPARVEFVADKTGKFRYRCSVSCGTMHPFMIGELIVGPNTPFWRAVALTVVAAAGTLAFLATRREGAIT
ncbi:MAG: cupredoxin domain-containing protein [Anaerolineae bacterium]